MKRLRKNDQVVVIAGRSKGHKGKVLKVLGERVLVEGANIVKKHVKPNPNVQEPGGIKSIESPVHISNVAILDPVSDKPTRVGYKYIDSDSGVKEKRRFCKVSGEILDAVDR